MKTNRLLFTGLLSLSAVAFGASAPPEKAVQPPNLIYIITDDLGYGDVSAYNPQGKISTPHLDRLAAEGMRFTDAHSSSSVCTPTRYNVLTGRYSWRTTLKRGVVNGYSPALLNENRLTLASLLQDHGYRTAMIGKWHLGMDVPFAGEPGRGAPIDWSGRIERTPTSNGFDYFWGHNASLDFPPYVYIENNHYTSQTIEHTDDRNYRQVYSHRPYTGPEDTPPVDDGKTVIRGAFRPGPIADNFDPFKTLDVFCNRAADYIRNVDAEKPFFLYVPLTSPHTPIVPTEEWLGKSGVGPYGDFVMQTDAGVGRILQAVEERGFTDNTLVVFTSDNGCSRAAGIDDLVAQEHFPSGPYRGSKADLWEGGHRVPHIVRWPAR
ncbi:MAG TPA: arylsulfatase, partial [Tichowtungia sp.]|nr:arylsulfatase [Tichowtungia sp.]